MYLPLAMAAWGFPMRMERPLKSPWLSKESELTQNWIKWI